MKERFLFCAALLVCGLAYAQSADFVTNLLQTPKATFGQVCYLTAVYRGLIDENASAEDAVNVLKSRAEVSEKTESESVADYADASRLFSKIWNVKGHLLFTLTKGSKRYAFKKFQKDGVVPAHADPQAFPSGVDILNIFTAGNEKYAASSANDDDSGAVKK